MMRFSTLCFFGATITLLAGIGLAVLLYTGNYKKGQVLSSIRCLWGSVFFSCIFLMLPIHVHLFAGEALCGFRAFLMALYSAMQQFVLGGDLEKLLAYSEKMSHSLRVGYSLIGVVLHVLAPILTFGFVMSFFRNLSSYRELLFRYRASLYIFSELNEKALVLAESIKKKDPKGLLVFTDVFENKEEPIFELCERVRELKGICFRRDIVDINWRMHSSKSEVSLFVIGEEESENIDQAIKLKETYKSDANFRLYVFASGAESEMLFTTAEKDGMRVRRCNPVRALISQNLYQEGDVYFREAIMQENGERLISVAIIGLGQYGLEMLKSLTWFCQMDGYRVEIHGFDKNPNIGDILKKQCPELLAPERNGVYEDGEAQYSIIIHSGIDVDTVQFVEELNCISCISHVFVALGSDGINAGKAMDIRMLCERRKQHPVIQAIVYSPLKSKAMENITDYRGHPYDIHFIGDFQQMYSEEVIIDSELENLALERHLKWGPEHEFWAYEFNYRSSVAAAIHMKMRISCKISGADKRSSDLTEEEKQSIAKLEHRRWNAYMRSDGYIFSGFTLKSSRNDLAKIHHDLVPYHRLSEEEKRKDSQIGEK